MRTMPAEVTPVNVVERHPADLDKYSICTCLPHIYIYKYTFNRSISGSNVNILAFLALFLLLFRHAGSGVRCRIVA